MSREQTIADERMRLAELHSRTKDPVILDQYRERVMESVDLAIAGFPDTSAPLAERNRAWNALRKDIEQAMAGKLVAEFGSRRCVDINTADLQDFYNRKMAETSASTANRYLSLIRSIFNRGKDWGDFHAENPVRAVKRRPENPHRMRFLDERELPRFLESCDERLYPLALCAVTTGLRFSEMYLLDWACVDLNNAALHILQSKSGKAREVPICSPLSDVIGKQPHRQGRVFPLPYMTFRRLFDRARNNSGIAPFCWHDLRHTFASHFVMRTGDLPALQKILGHASTQMTLRYAHLAQGHLKAKMELFSAAIPTLRQCAPSGIGHPEGHQMTALAR